MFTKPPTETLPEEESLSDYDERQQSATNAVDVSNDDVTASSSLSCKQRILQKIINGANYDDDESVLQNIQLVIHRNGESESCCESSVSLDEVLSSILLLLSRRATAAAADGDVSSSSCPLDITDKYDWEHMFTVALKVALKKVIVLSFC